VSLRVLAITKIFPNSAEPLSAPFNRQQFAELARLCELAGIAVSHPRTLFVPRLAHVAWGPLYAASIAPAVARHRGRIDIVLGSWAYPDGFAAVIAARLLGVPCVVKLHGSDINIIAQMPGPRRLTEWALPRAARVVAVSRALADEAVALGVHRDRISIVMNGVDSQLFHPRDRASARTELGLPPGPLALYVGNLKPEKGVLDLAAAWSDVAREVPDARLVIVGGGPAREALATQIGPGIQLAGPQPLSAIPTWLAACDVLVLPSHAEGTPNVVLGRRVVATAVGGIPDLISSPTLGTLVPPGDPRALGAAIARALRLPYDHDEVAGLGARGGWAASAEALHAVLVAATNVTVGAA